MSNGKNGIKTPWNDRANMLRRRSLAFTAREAAPDLLGGIYLPEELEEIQMRETEPGSYAAQEIAADKKAEADPGYAITPKAIAAKPTEQTINIPKTAAPERVAASLHQDANKPTSKPGPTVVKGDGLEITDDDAPKVNAPDPPPNPAQELKKQAIERMNAWKRLFGFEKITQVSNFIQGFNDGKDIKENPALWNAALDALERSNSIDPEKAKAAMTKDAKGYGVLLAKKVAEYNAQQHSQQPEAQQQAPTGEEPNPYTKAFGWTNPQVLSMAWELKGNRALGGWIETLRTVGFSTLHIDEVIPAFQLYKLGGSVFQICRVVGASPSVVLKTFQAHMAELGDATAASAATIREIKGE